MIKFNIITLFPDLIKYHLNNLPYKRALQKKLIEVNIVNLRTYALDSYGTVDDKPYGGGTGMLLRIEPIYKALEDLKLRGNKSKKILLSPKGKKYNQKKARLFADLAELTLICGRYEGVDARVEELVDESLSVGDYILSGGELGALIVMESTTRLIPGVLEKEEAVSIESFTDNQLEYPQYTRPEKFKGLSVPEVLLSGNHKKIEKWRKVKSQKAE